MAKNLGTFTFAANFQVKAAEALDPRMVAASKADLINKANWPSDGDTIYVYNGLIVDCGADGVYRLIDKTKALASDYSGWERIDAGGVKIDNIFTYKGSVASYTELPVLKNTGDVYNIESAFTLTTGEGETAISYDYPAGTNVAWNGTSWDPLAGSIDLSAYATKEEVSTIRTDVATNATNISNLSTALGNTNLEVAKKVDAVEGSSLITADKLALIDTNAADIQTLESQNLDSRVSALEGMFKDGDTDISLTNITSILTEHTSKLTALESDNTTNKTNIGNLQTQAEGYGNRLTAIETLNTEQSTQLSSLTTRVDNVEKYGEAITNLTNTVNGHTESISTLNTGVSEAKALASSEAANALTSANAYADSLASNYDAAGSAKTVDDKLKLHAEDTTLHITEDERIAWNEAKDAINTFLKDAELDAEGKSVIDTLKELQSYMTSDGSAAAELVNRVAALEEIDHEAYIAADTTVLNSAKGYTDSKLLELGTAATKDVEYFATAEALTALNNVVAMKADVYTKTETDNAIANAFNWIDIE